MVYADPMARFTVAPEARRLAALRCPVGHDLHSTVTTGGDGFSLCAHVRVRWLTDDQVRVSVACWAVSTDFARYVGGRPPTDGEYRLAPDGTARPDEGFTERVTDRLAACLNALDAPHPERDGHLAITVPAAELVPAG